MIENQAHMMDKDKRVGYVHDIQRKVIDESCQLAMYNATFFWATKPYVHIKNYYHPSSSGNAEFYWMEKH